MKNAFLQRFVNRFIWNTESRGSTHTFGSNSWNALWDFLGYGKDKDSGEEVTPESGTQMNTVFNCLNILGQDIATFPKQVRRDSDKGKIIIKDSVHHLLNHAPNSLENSWHFWYGIIFLGEGWGNSYAYISKRDESGNATEMLRLKPWMVRPEIVEGELFYVVNKVALPASDVFHYRSFVADSPIGESKILYNKKTVGLKQKQHKFSAKAIGSKPPGILFVKATEEQRQKIREIWNSQVKGDDITGTPVMSGENIEYKQLMMSPDSVKMVEANRITDEYIMGLWRMQPAMLSIHHESNYNVVEQQNINHVKYTLLPIITNLEQEINSKLFPEINKRQTRPRFVKFNVKALLRGDVKTQTAFYQFGIVNGVFNADEIREWEDLPPQLNKDGNKGPGQVYYIQGAMTEKGTIPDEPISEGRMMDVLDEFAKKHKLNGYSKNEIEV